MEYVEKLPNWLRWILVPVACILALLLVHLALAILFWLQEKFMGMGEDAWFGLIYNHIVTGGLTGYATVIIGCLVAPSHRKVVCLAVGGILVMICGLTLLVVLAKHQYWEAADTVATVIGVGVAIYTIFEEEQAKARWASSV